MGIEEGVRVYNYLVDQGLTPMAAAGYAGHFAEETGWFDPAVARLERRGDGGVARGIAQWHPDRWEPLQSYAQTAGVDPRSWEGQIQLMLHESTSGLDGGAARALREANAAQTLEDAVAAVAHFERSAGYKSNNPSAIDTYQKRLNHARQIMQAAGGGNYSSAPSNSAYGAYGTYGSNATNSTQNPFSMLLNTANPYGSKPNSDISNSLISQFGPAMRNPYSGVR